MTAHRTLEIIPDVVSPLKLNALLPLALFTAADFKIKTAVITRNSSAIAQINQTTAIPP